MDAATDFHRFDLITSNRGYVNYLDTTVNVDGYYGFTMSALADMDASDTAYVRMYQAGGTAQTDIRTDSWFSGYLAC